MERVPIGSTFCRRRARGQGLPAPFRRWRGLPRVLDHATNLRGSRRRMTEHNRSAPATLAVKREGRRSTSRHAPYPATTSPVRTWGDPMQREKEILHRSAPWPAPPPPRSGTGRSDRRAKIHGQACPRALDPRDPMHQYAPALRNRDQTPARPDRGRDPMQRESARKLFRQPRPWRAVSHPAVPAARAGSRKSTGRPALGLWTRGTPCTCTRQSPQPGPHPRTARPGRRRACPRGS
jgi:hypothetical protein